MEYLNVKQNVAAWFHQAKPPFFFHSPFPGRDYMAIVYFNEAATADASRRLVECALYAAGCRGALFAGHINGEWEVLQEVVGDEPPEEAFRPYSFIDEDAVEDVVYYARWCMLFQGAGPERFLVLSLGERAGLRGEVEAAIRSVWPNNADAPSPKHDS